MKDKVHIHWSCSHAWYMFICVQCTYIWSWNSHCANMHVRTHMHLIADENLTYIYVQYSLRSSNPFTCTHTYTLFHVGTYHHWPPQPCPEAPPLEPHWRGHWAQVWPGRCTHPQHTHWAQGLRPRRSHTRGVRTGFFWVITWVHSQEGTYRVHIHESQEQVTYVSCTRIEDVKQFCSSQELCKCIYM